MNLSLKTFLCGISLTFLTVYIVLAFCITLHVHFQSSAKRSQEIMSVNMNMVDISLHGLDINSYENLHQAKRNKNNCQKEVRNFVFIKCMKCATETLASVFRRFGYIRDLNFILPVKRNLYLGWPFPLQMTDIRQSKYQFNILAEHSIFNHSFMKALMPNDTTFITILRNPWQQVKSTINYFDISEIANVPNQSFKTYFEHMEYYDSVYGNPKNNLKRWCIPDGFSMTRNILAHCVGMPLGFPTGTENILGNESEVNKYIEHLKSSFDLVLIADYFEESLVLLKRKMCWSFKDIVYHYSNKGDYKNEDLKDLPPRGKYFDIHRNWSSIDYKLFNEFNETFWTEISDEGPDFYEELNLFRTVQTKVKEFCFKQQMSKIPKRVLSFSGSRFEAGFIVTGEECVLMSTYLLPVLWARHYEKEGVAPDNITYEKPVKGCSM